MDKFTAVNSDVMSGLAASGLEVYPEDYSGNIANEKRFARYSVLMPTSYSYEYSRGAMVSGMLMIRLFSERGFAGKDSYTDAATLNTALESKLFSNNTRFGKSMLTQPQPDADNESLVMVVYSIPFTYYE